MAFKHLSPEERHYIEIELRKGTSQNKIAESLGRSQGALSREINRNKGLRGYRHQQAHRKAQQRHKEKPKAVKLTEDIYQFIEDDKCNGGTLYKHLRHQKKPYRKRYGSAHNRTGIPNRVGIEERPEIVNNRGRIGDWEADTVIGKNHKGAIATLDERKTKLRLAVPLPGKKAKAVKQAVIDVLKPLKRFVKTITYDNGKEFVQHEAIGKALSCDSYFAAPYHSWERGQNENANGLLRQYFPKSMELHNVK